MSGLLSTSVVAICYNISRSSLKEFLFLQFSRCLPYEGIIVAKVFSMPTLKSQICNSKFEVVNIFFACVH